MQSITRKVQQLQSSWTAVFTWMLVNLGGESTRVSLLAGLATESVRRACRVVHDRCAALGRFCLVSRMVENASSSRPQSMPLRPRTSSERLMQTVVWLIVLVAAWTWLVVAVHRQRSGAAV